MDILLAHAYFLSEDAQERRIMKPHPPLGLLYLSSHLKAHGVKVDVFDGTFSAYRDFEECLARERPPVVGIYVNLMTKRHALRMLASARAAGSRVVVGGPDPPHYAAEYLDAGADVVVIGEGEDTLLELLRDRHLLPKRCRVDGTLRGIAYKDESGGVVTTAARPLLPDLDAQPLPDRGAVAMDHYLRAWRSRHGFGVVSLITARGCPYTCTWCSRSVFGQTHRRRSPAAVADEVESIVQRYRPERLWYADDVFAIHRAWTLAYAGELQRRRLRLPFECISRAERIDDAVADALAELGCWRVWIGAESGSQRVLDAMQRKVAVEQVVDAAERLRRRRIQVGTFIMLGYDGEDESDIRRTIEHLQRVAPDTYLTTVAYPIKGTPYHRAVAHRIVATRSWRERSDRDLIVSGRPGPRYYEFARRWIAGEVARHGHWRHRRYAAAARAASAALVGRIGMKLTGRLLAAHGGADAVAGGIGAEVVQP
jgi:radical SAM superfamily enzyme YgiQ (UPF0313 family)